MRTNAIILAASSRRFAEKGCDERKEENALPRLARTASPILGTVPRSLSSIRSGIIRCLRRFMEALAITQARPLANEKPAEIRRSMGKPYGLISPPDLASGEKCPMVIPRRGFKGYLNCRLKPRNGRSGRALCLCQAPPCDSAQFPPFNCARRKSNLERRSAIRSRDERAY